MDETPPAWGDQALAALSWAAELHAGQTRRSGPVPYLSHVLSVAGLVIDDGADEDEVVAALLHDAVEAGGGRAMLEEVGRRYGPHVAEIVNDCTDTVDGGDRPWADRKAGHVAHLGARDAVSISALRVLAADKLDNVRALVAAIRVDGDVAWSRFPADPGFVRSYYGAMADLLASRLPASRSVLGLQAALDELDQLGALPVAAVAEFTG